MAGCLADEHIAGSLVRALRLAGIDVVTVQERGLAGADDARVAELALREKRFLLTNDVDFLRLVSRARERQQPVAPVIFWPRAARRSVRTLVEGVRSVTQAAPVVDAEGQVFFL